MQHNQPFGEFREIVRSENELRAIVGHPTPKVAGKIIGHLDDICRAFIAGSPFCILATAGPDGKIDVSPRGDPPGFVRVLDDRRLAIPDRPGNRLADSFTNLLINPRIGILFMVPGKEETLRIRGEARIVRDPALRETMAVDGKVPKLALVVHVTEAFVHCPKNMIRSHLWQPGTWPDSSALPDIGNAMIRHGNLTDTPDELFDEAKREGLTDLY